MLKVAERHGVGVTLVANFGLRPSRDPMVNTVMVPQGADAADDWIVNHARNRSDFLQNFDALVQRAKR